MNFQGYCTVDKVKSLASKQTGADSVLTDEIIQDFISLTAAELNGILATRYEVPVLESVSPEAFVLLRSINAFGGASLVVDAVTAAKTVDFPVSNPFARAYTAGKKQLAGPVLDAVYKGSLPAVSWLTTAENIIAALVAKALAAHSSVSTDEAAIVARLRVLTHPYIWLDTGQRIPGVDIEQNFFARLDDILDLHDVEERVQFEIRQLFGVTQLVPRTGEDGEQWTKTGDSMDWGAAGSSGGGGVSLAEVDSQIADQVPASFRTAIARSGADRLLQIQAGGTLAGVDLSALLSADRLAALGGYAGKKAVMGKDEDDSLEWMDRLPRVGSGSALPSAAGLDEDDLFFKSNDGLYKVVDSAVPSNSLPAVRWTPSRNGAYLEWGFDLRDGVSQFGSRPTGWPDTVQALIQDGNNMVWLYSTPGTFSTAVNGIVEVIVNGTTLSLPYDRTAQGTDHYSIGPLSRTQWGTDEVSIAIHALGGPTPFQSVTKDWSKQDSVAPDALAALLAGQSDPRSSLDWRRSGGKFIGTLKDDAVARRVFVFTEAPTSVAGHSIGDLAVVGAAGRDTELYAVEPRLSAVEERGLVRVVPDPENHDADWAEGDGSITPNRDGSGRPAIIQVQVLGNVAFNPPGWGWLIYIRLGAFGTSVADVPNFYLGVRRVGDSAWTAVGLLSSSGVGALSPLAGETGVGYRIMEGPHSSLAQSIGQNPGGFDLELFKDQGLTQPWTYRPANENVPDAWAKITNRMSLPSSYPAEFPAVDNGKILKWVGGVLRNVEENTDVSPPLLDSVPTSVLDKPEGNLVLVDVGDKTELFDLSQDVDRARSEEERSTTNLLFDGVEHLIEWPGGALGSAWNNVRADGDPFVVRARVDQDLGNVGGGRNPSVKFYLDVDSEPAMLYPRYRRHGSGQAWRDMTLVRRAATDTATVEGKTGRGYGAALSVAQSDQLIDPSGIDVVWYVDAAHTRFVAYAAAVGALRGEYGQLTNREQVRPETLSSASNRVYAAASPGTAISQSVFAVAVGDTVRVRAEVQLELAAGAVAAAVSITYLLSGDTSETTLKTSSDQSPIHSSQAEVRQVNLTADLAIPAGKGGEMTLKLRLTSASAAHSAGDRTLGVVVYRG